MRRLEAEWSIVLRMERRLVLSAASREDLVAYTVTPETTVTILQQRVQGLERYLGLGRRTGMPGLKQSRQKRHHTRATGVYRYLGGAPSRAAGPDRRCPFCHHCLKPVSDARRKAAKVQSPIRK